MKTTFDLFFGKIVWVFPQIFDLIFRIFRNFSTSKPPKKVEFFHPKWVLENYSETILN